MTSLQPDARFNWGGRIRRWVGIWIVLLGAQAAFGCSSPDAPQPLPTVLVTNATCDLGRCATLEIRVYVWKFTIPFPPDGEELLADVPPGQTCLTFPPSWSWRIIGPDTSGRVDTLTMTWTPADTVPIYLIALDSVFYHSPLDSAQYDSVAQRRSYFDGLWKGSVGETPNFAPGQSPGWKVTFPSSPPWSAKLVPSEACNS